MTHSGIFYVFTFLEFYWWKLVAQVLIICIFPKFDQNFVEVFLGSRRAERRSLNVPKETLSIFLMMIPLARSLSWAWRCLHRIVSVIFCPNDLFQGCDGPRECPRAAGQPWDEVESLCEKVQLSKIIIKITERVLNQISCTEVNMATFKCSISRCV